MCSAECTPCKNAGRCPCTPREGLARSPSRLPRIREKGEPPSLRYLFSPYRSFSGNCMPTYHFIFSVEESQKRTLVVTQQKRFCKRRACGAMGVGEHSGYALCMGANFVQICTYRFRSQTTRVDGRSVIGEHYRALADITSTTTDGRFKTQRQCFGLDGG